MSLTVTTNKTSMDGYMISLTGTLDTETYPLLDKELDPLLERNPQLIVFDLKELVFISSMGIRSIVKAMKSLKNNRGQVLLVNTQPQIQKVFDIIKILPKQKIFSSIEELDEYLDAIQRKALDPDA
jgi:anti-sigma B factor antagonist